ncbi:unnamed protein product [Symbiodinium pilosum]|uniref:Uncharacterized protein n=1 Tax=Symbiodinium pilosum TaxID=2952 RepID=A0A812Y2N8_SYMPI|nr:unnamed protein product [Symbiodinium pilosum]
MVLATQVSSQGFFELSASSLRIFQRAVQCIAKLGRDAAVIFRPEELVLHGADDGHSAASQFAFRRKFFRSTPSQAYVQERLQHALCTLMEQGGEGGGVCTRARCGVAWLAAAHSPVVQLGNAQ